MVASALRWAGEHLTVGKIEETTEGFGNGLPFLLLAVNARKQGNFHKHAGYKERSLQELSVDVHVEGQLTLALCLLLLGSEDLIALSVDALSEEFLDALGGEDVLEDRLRLLDETAAEGAETELDDSAIIEDLCRDVGRVDRLLQVRHE